ncbi:hypothetical protein [Aeromonas sp. FDAARGOS 1402]|uniref:hypothetical protein n=1 Tax=Aeromonas sp. FDAARGOS 1402 TaxID=2778051 RepID=UPI0020B1B8C2|nr:hypothetical protein [Aeromonas sp. FDAARGOS 1402]
MQVPPADPNVGLCLINTRDHHDTRANARDVLERYLARGPKWRGFLYDTQLEGQRAIRFFQRVEVRLPEVGETLVRSATRARRGSSSSTCGCWKSPSSWPSSRCPTCPSSRATW